MDDVLDCSLYNLVSVTFRAIKLIGLNLKFTDLLLLIFVTNLSKTFVSRETLFQKKNTLVLIYQKFMTMTESHVCI